MLNLVVFVPFFKFIQSYDISPVYTILFSGASS